MFAKKKRIELVGSLAYPLMIGNAAFINKQKGSPIRTSAVQHFIQMPSGVIHIETQNTRYVLRPAKEVRTRNLQRKARTIGSADWQKPGSIKSCTCFVYLEISAERPITDIPEIR